MNAISIMNAISRFSRAHALAALLPLVPLVSGACATAPPGGGTDSPRLYVTNQAAAAVSVVDVEAGTVEVVDLRGLGFGPTANPHHVVVEPDGSHWYVSLIGENRVLKFDRANRLVAAIEFERPGLLALHPTEDWLFVGRSMAAVNPPQRIGRIDRSSMEIEEFEVFVPRPHALAVHPGGEWVFVGSLAENSVVVVDARSGDAEIERLQGEMVHVLVQYAVSPDGRTLVATAEHSDRLLVFDLTVLPELRLVTEVPVGDRPWHPAFSPDGRHVWFGNLGADEVTVVDARTWQVEDVVRGEGLAQPHGLAISPDGRRVYVSNRNEAGSFAGTREHGYEGPPGTVVVIDAGSRAIVDVIEIPPYGSGAGMAQPR